MYVAAGTLILSATDLVGFLECEHLLQLDQLAAAGQIPRPVRVDEGLALVSALGDAHEARHLALHRASGRTVVEIADHGNQPEGLRAAEQETLAAMWAGTDVIYQATFFDGRWLGKADFLVRVCTPTTLGSHGYEVVDTKLARRARTSALLQVALYSQHVARLQGALPERMHLILGDDSQLAFPVSDFVSYARTALTRMEEQVAASPLPTYPERVGFCSRCRWDEVCSARRRDDDHLSLVAGIRRDQIRRLGTAGLTTLRALAEAPDAPVALTVAGISDHPLTRIQAQARLQLAARETGERRHQLTAERNPGIGLGALPEPNPADLFFDMEGDPHFDETGLEYLFGVVALDAARRPHFSAWWAHDRAAEKRAFEAFVDFVIARWRSAPGLHVYHYANYEVDALKKLMGRHATREREVDEMLRRELFVDLYQAVRQGLRISEESYSLKSVERFYLPPRQAAVTDAGSSIVQYERWRQDRDPQILADIAAYNRADCESTAGLRDWLERLRDDSATADAPLPRPVPSTQQPSEALLRAEDEVAGLTAALLDGVDVSAPRRDPDQQARWLLAQSLSWHRREEKADWWAFFERREKTDEELVGDREALGDIALVGLVGQVKKWEVYRYRYDPGQEHRIKVGEMPPDARTQHPAGRVEALDPELGLIDLRRAVGSDNPHPTSLVPGGPIPTIQQRAAIRRLAERILQGGLSGRDVEAAGDLLRRRPPNCVGGRLEVGAMLNTTLAIQGPPGTGKTHTGAQMIVDLVEQGLQVGVTANSHKVISNLLLAVQGAAGARGHRLRLLHRCNEEDHCGDAGIARTSSNSDVADALREGRVDVVGGTAWLWSREEVEGSLSHLFIDEAGQMSLANVLAVSGAAANLVLLGDPQQLAQPSKGAHPDGADVSALTHVLGGAATLAPDQGLFLDTTWRMHPDVCRFISDSSYDGRLSSQPGCELQAIDAPGGASGTGIRYLPAFHRGNRTASPEEAALVARLFSDLESGTFTDRAGGRRFIRRDDILVVAPFNAHVAQLRAALPEGARVGTVDKFQGQQAPIVIYSLATSTPDDLPRHMEFLYSLNRLNVAVSRAQALAIVVCSPVLLRIRAGSPEQMRLANALCMLVEQSRPVDLSELRTARAPGAPR